MSICCNHCNCGGCPRWCNNCRPNNYVTLTGTVLGVDSLPVAGLEIKYIVNGCEYTWVTDANGRYTICVPAYSSVTIIPQIGLGVTVTPMEYHFDCLNSNQSGLDFVLGPVVLRYTLSGTLTGVNGLPAAFYPVTASINGESVIVYTDTDGSYSLSVNAGSNVVIAPQALVGVVSTPLNYTLNNVQANATNLNFVLSAV